MNYEPTPALQLTFYSFIEATLAADRARRAEEKAKTELDKAVQAEMVRCALGRGALVEHVHADAHHGNASDKLVVSKVVNAYGLLSREGKVEVMLRINLGRANGKGLSDQYASLALSDVRTVKAGSMEGFL